MSALIDERRYLIPFRSGLLPNIFTGTLVIGGGVAGLRAALAAAQPDDADVIIVCKGALETSSTAWAQGGIAAVTPGSVEAGDSVEQHVEDTLKAGAGLCDGPIVRLVCEAGAREMERLLDRGMAFDRDASAAVRLGREGGHSAHRILHAGGDRTGRELQRVLGDAVRAHPRIRVFERCFALDLLTPSAAPGSPVLGAMTHHARHGLQSIWARTTILATGGAGRVYRETTNPGIATADGLAMAYRAGATLADMAFVQFHPTVLYLPGAGRHLISEAVRGEGALLVNDAGRRFMEGEHELAELAPRDVVSRAIVRELARSGGSRVWLDARHIEGFAERFPGISQQLARYKIDVRTDLIPVHPAAHYTIGGVRTDAVGQTDVPGLLAVGEVASTGLHGANRLASNSLLEGLVIGAAAGELAGTRATSRDAGGGTATVSGNETAQPVGPTPIISDIPPSDHGELDMGDVRSSLRSAMWRNVGVERTGSKLDDAVDMLQFWARYTLDKVFDSPSEWETQNMLVVATLIARASRWRVETRGAHTRSDAHDAEEAFRVHDLWRRGHEECETSPVLTADGTAALASGA
ncbi:MAG: L-aspartate oxidase [Planctomycetota bacterium]